ncbi:MAG: trypsin-like peptidase domain-containing protein [Verrucomicrobiota bacterium]
MHQRWSRILGVAIIFAIAAAAYYGLRSKSGNSTDRYGLFDLLNGEKPPLTSSGEGFTPPSKPLLGTREVRHIIQLNEEYAALTKAVVPSVVSLRTSKTVNIQRLQQTNLGAIPQNQRLREPGLGSGVIVTKEGHLITNHHVIGDVDEVEITLHDGRKYPAEFVGSDPQTDVAILKILAPDKPDGKPTVFPALPMGDSDKVEVGETVISVGNPFGLSETVTRGIISNRDRRITDMSVSFLQSDTVINPGSSGGPLLNARGEIIGITTDLFLGQAGLRTWQGIALAIPINDVRHSFEAIMSRSELGRGYLGIVAEEMLPEIASQLNLPPYRGAFVLEVLPRSPAEKAGLKGGDIILSFAGEEIVQGSNLIRSVRRQSPGSDVAIGILRAGVVHELTATIAQRSAEVALEQSTQNPDARISEVAGIKVSAITPEQKQQIGLMPNSPAVVVTAVDPRSDLGRSGSIQTGDLIHEVNRVAVDSPKELYTALDRMPLNRRSLLLVTRKGNYGFVMLVPRVPAQPETGPKPAPKSKSKPTPEENPPPSAENPVS